MTTVTAPAKSPRLRLNALHSRTTPIWSCEDHEAVHDAGTECPGPAFDARLARAVSVRTAIAFGDWPPGQ